MEDSPNFWRAFVAASPSPSTPEDLFSVLDRLSLEEKAALVEYLLTSSNLVAGFNGSQISGSLIGSIHEMDRDMLAELLQAIARRMRAEGSKREGEVMG